MSPEIKKFEPEKGLLATCLAVGLALLLQVLVSNTGLTSGPYSVFWTGVDDISMVVMMLGFAALVTPYSLDEHAATWQRLLAGLWMLIFCGAALATVVLRVMTWVRP